MPKEPPPDLQRHYADGVELGRLSHGAGRLEYERCLDLLSRWLPKPPATGIDVGGGPGVYSFALTRQGYHVHLLDLMPNHIGAAHRTEAENRAGLASAQVGDARALPYEAGSADFVLLMGPLYHLTDAAERRRALGEAVRCLRPGGTLVAAAVSRYASLMDGAGQGFALDPAFQSIIDADLQTGQHRNPGNHPAYFTTAYFHRPEELAAELSQSGLTGVSVVGVEGPVWTSPRIDNLLDDPSARSRLMDWLRRIESEPSILGASSHLLARGTNP